MSQNRFTIPFLAVMAMIFIFVSGCSKKEAPAPQAAAINASFEAAAPELKQHWKMAHEAVDKKDYFNAFAHLEALANSASQLAPEQLTALRQMWSDFGSKLFEAASAGNKTAAEVLKKMQVSNFGNPGGR